MVGIVGLVVAYGIALQTFLSQKIITDQEYIQGSYMNYEITRCEEPKYVGEISQEKTPQEIEQCKEKATENVILQRNYNNKESTISGLLRGTLFLILFAIHFPFFLRKEK
ncbi:hypothetical protein K9M48_00010 [Candidatus Gracilibacteria bacterium]|nr:hypothetical protein [Candidatus Gracilibacteria bacterium]